MGGDVGAEDNASSDGEEDAPGEGDGSEDGGFDGEAGECAEGGFLFDHAVGGKGAGEANGDPGDPGDGGELQGDADDGNGDGQELQTKMFLAKKKQPRKI